MNALAYTGHLAFIMQHISKGRDERHAPRVNGRLHSSELFKSSWLDTKVSLCVKADSQVRFSSPGFMHIFSGNNGGRMQNV